MKKSWLAVTLIAATMIFSVIVFNDLPARVPTHFNASGEPDRWASRAFAVFALPLLALGVLLLFHLYPRLTPRHENAPRAEDTYWLFAATAVGLMCALHVLVLARALGWPIDITSATLLGLGLMFLVVGSVLPRMRSNWFMGIRTPWTMRSETVWQGTHRVAAKTFMIGGGVTVVAALLPERLRPWIAVGALLVAGFIPVVYSYVLWRREQQT